MREPFSRSSCLPPRFCQHGLQYGADTGSTRPRVDTSGTVGQIGITAGFGLTEHEKAVKPTAIAAILVALPLLAAAPAHADFRVCNDTGSLVGVALGYSEEGDWVTEGWWQIPGETCASLLEGTLNSRYYYIYAEDADRGGQWRGDIMMCTANAEFRIEGIDGCLERGYQRTGFYEIDTDNRDSWMVRLTEAGRSSP